MLGRGICTCLLTVILFSLACGGDDDAGSDPPDAGNQTDAAVGPRCSAEPHARFDVTASPESGQLLGTYSDVAWPTTVEEKMREGACAYFAPEPPFCDPECAGETICATGGVCRGFPRPMNIGTVRVTGTDPELELEPDAFNNYYTDSALPGLYQPGDELTLTAGGSGDIDALSLTVRGVAPLVVGSPAVTAREHEDLVLEWEPDPSSPEGTELVFRADNDHHGIVAYIECHTADDGELVVPAAILDELILAGETGIGTYIENAHMTRSNRDTAETDLGCASFQSLSQVFIGVETIRAD
jgi:hypothetical protein